MSEVGVRYMIDDVPAAIAFYTTVLGFTLERVKKTLDDLRAQPGKDIWLFGGGELFRSLGGGHPFLPPPAVRRRLSLTGQRVYEQSGIILLKYDVVPDTAGGKSRKRKARRR